MRLIDADELEEIKWNNLDTLWGRGWNSAIDAVIQNATTINVEPIKKGYWTNVPRPGIQCSECKATIIVEMQYAHYCPNCGAKMEDEIRGWTQLQDYRT